MATYRSLARDRIPSSREQAMRLNALAWTAFVSGNSTPMSALMAIDAFTIVNSSDDPMSGQKLSIYTMILDTVAANLWTVGRREDATQCQANAVAASFVLPRGRSDEMGKRLREFDGELPDPPDDRLLFTSPFATNGFPLADDASQQAQQVNLAKIDAAVREYLNRVAPLPELNATRAALREDMPLPLSPDAKLGPLVDDLLRLLHDTYDGD